MLGGTDLTATLPCGIDKEKKAVKGGGTVIQLRVRLMRGGVRTTIERYNTLAEAIAGHIAHTCDADPLGNSLTLPWHEDVPRCWCGACLIPSTSQLPDHAAARSCRMPIRIFWTNTVSLIL